MLRPLASGAKKGAFLPHVDDGLAPLSRASLLAGKTIPGGPFYLDTRRLWCRVATPTAGQAIGSV